LLQQNKKGDNNNVAIAFFFSCNVAKKATTTLLLSPSSLHYLLFFCYNGVNKVMVTLLRLPFSCRSVAKKVTTSYGHLLFVLLQHNKEGDRSLLSPSFCVVATQQRRRSQLAIAFFFLCCCNVAKRRPQPTIAFFFLFVYRLMKKVMATKLSSPSFCFVATQRRRQW